MQVLSAACHWFSRVVQPIVICAIPTPDARHDDPIMGFVSAVLESNIPSIYWHVSQISSQACHSSCWSTKRNKCTVTELKVLICPCTAIGRHGRHCTHYRPLQSVPDDWARDFLHISPSRRCGFARMGQIARAKRCCRGRYSDFLWSCEFKLKRSSNGDLIGLSGVCNRLW